MRCVELPVTTQGETRDETLTKAKEAIEAYLEVKSKPTMIGPRTRIARNLP